MSLDKYKMPRLGDKYREVKEEKKETEKKEKKESKNK